jgi:hypothetical protein
MRPTLKNCFFVVGAFLAVSLSAQQSKWSAVQRLEEKHVVDNLGQHGADNPIVALIKGADGVPVYKLECHTGEYDNESEMNFSGDYQCALFGVQGTKLKTGDLLAADSKDELSTDWWNRGRVRGVQLRGECLRYPEYSTDRQFKLRGMLVTLRLADIRWSSRNDKDGNPLLMGFTLALKVAPDESARSSRAELVAGPKPPISCYP